MDGIGRMKFVWMMMMGILSIVVQAAHNPPAVSPTSSLPFSQLPDHPPQLQSDFKLPKFPKFPHIPLPPKVLITGLCIYECHGVCEEAPPPSITYRACMVTCLSIKCRPSRLDVVDDCALACMAAATTAASGDRINFLSLSLALSYF
jgi:hypothetical protein